MPKLYCIRYQNQHQFEQSIINRICQNKTPMSYFDGYLNYMLIKQQQNNLEMSNFTSPQLTKANICSFKKRCLSDLESRQDIEIFQPAKQPLPCLLNSLPKEAEYEGKIFRNRVNCHQQIFAYVHLVLCFETKKSNSSSAYLDYIYQLIQKPQFQLILSQESSLNGQSQIKIKNILSQFLNELNLGSAPVLKSLKKYPMVLQIFVSFYRTLLILGDACTSFHQTIPMTEIYEFLTSYFDIEMEIGTNYLFFTQANIYVNQSNNQQVYMFIPSQTNYSLIQSKLEQYSAANIMNADTSLFSKSKIGQCSPTKKTPKSRRNSKKISLQQHTQLLQKIKSKIDQSHHQSFGKFDGKSKISFNYTQSEQNQNNQKDLSLISKRDSHHQNIIGSKQSKKNLHSVCFDLENLPSPDEHTKYEKKVLPSTHYRNKSEHCEKIGNKQNYSFCSQLLREEDTKTQKMLGLTATTQATQKETNKQLKSSQNEQKHTQQIFYRPYIQKIAWKENKKPWVNQNVTKQFTSSFILEYLPQPYRTSIKTKKQRARHIRKSTQDHFFYQK